MTWAAPRYSWCIYYDDGSTFSSEQGSPEDSPVAGAVLVLQPRVYGRNFVGRGEPFFLYRSDLGEWFACDLAGLLDQLSHFAPLITCVRVGRWMATDAWVAVQQQADHDLRGPHG